MIATTRADAGGGSGREDRSGAGVINAELQKSLLYIGIQYGNDVTFFFAHQTSCKKKVFINLECAKASRADFKDVTLRADSNAAHTVRATFGMRRRAAADFIVHGYRHVQPGTLARRVGGAWRRGPDKQRHPTGEAADGVYLRQKQSRGAYQAMAAGVRVRARRITTAPGPTIVS